MANATDFEGSNFTMLAPEGTEDEIGDLNCLRCEGQLVSCWQLTPEELEEIAQTGVVWLHVIGDGMPAVYVNGNNPVRITDEFSGERRPARPQPILPAKVR